MTDAQHAAIQPLPLNDLVDDNLDQAIKNSWPILKYSAERIALDIGFEVMFKKVDREALIAAISEWKINQKVAALCNSLIDPAIHPVVTAAMLDDAYLKSAIDFMRPTMPADRPAAEWPVVEALRRNRRPPHRVGGRRRWASLRRRRAFDFLRRRFRNHARRSARGGGRSVRAARRAAAGGGVMQSDLFREATPSGPSSSTALSFTCDPSVPAEHVRMFVEKVAQYPGPNKPPPFTHVLSTVVCPRRAFVVVARLTMFDGAYAELELFENGTMKDGSTVWGNFWSFSPEGFPEFVDGRWRRGDPNSTNVTLRSRAAPPSPSAVMSRLTCGDCGKLVNAAAMVNLRIHCAAAASAIVNAVGKLSRLRPH